MKAHKKLVVRIFLLICKNFCIICQDNKVMTQNIQKAFGKVKTLACFGAKLEQQVVFAIFAYFLV